MRDKIFTLFRTESAPSQSPHAEQDGFQRFMEEYAKQQGTALGLARNESAGLHIQAASPRGERGM
jgi:hypothetical protein